MNLWRLAQSHPALQMFNQARDITARLCAGSVDHHPPLPPCVITCIAIQPQRDSGLGVVEAKPIAPVDRVGTRHLTQLAQDHALQATVQQWVL